MKVKKIILILSIFFILISISNVSAIDIDENTTYGSEIDSNDENILTSPMEEPDNLSIGYGYYNGPNNEPSWIVNDYEIKINKVISENNVEIFVNFSGITQVTDFDLNTYPAYILENEEIIGTLPISSVSNTDFPTTYPTPYSFNATFNYEIKDYDTELKIRLCGLDSNRIVFHKNPPAPIYNLNENSIIIDNQNGEIITSNSSWTNSIESLKKALELVKNNGIIYLNNISIYSNQNLKNGLAITKNIKIIGENVRINGMDNANLFNITSNVTFKNVLFENTLDYLIINNGECILDNCTFTNTDERAINNFGKVTIMNSAFKDINELHTLSKMKIIDNVTCLIYNQNELQIINTTFKNIVMPHKIKIYENNNYKQISPSSIICNLNNAQLNISNSSFDTIDAKLITNDGEVNIENSNFTTVNSQTPCIEIILGSDNEITLENTQITSYKFNWDNESGTGPIYSTNQLIINNCNFIDFAINPQYFVTKAYGAFEYLLNNNWYTIYIKRESDANTDLYGGVVYNTGNLIINESYFKNTQASTAGAIYNTGNTTITKTNTYNIISNSNSGCGGIIYNTGFVNISDSFFNKSAAQELGGAIRNLGKLTITNTTIYDTNANRQFGSSLRGGAISNAGELNISNSAIIKSEALGRGGAIHNTGNMTINTTIIEKSSSSLGIIHNDEDAYANIYNSMFIDNRLDGFNTNPEIVTYGIILNQGNMVFDRNIIDFRRYNPGGSSGTYGIYNSGNIIITHNLFINTTTYKVDRWGNPLSNIRIYIQNEGGDTNINHNYFDTNADPYNNFSTEMVGHYFVLDIEPEYSPLQIGEKTNITATLKLDNGKYYKNYNLLPDITIEFTITGKNEEYMVYAPLVDGKATIEFNKSQEKGSYDIKAKLGYCIKETTVDIGKNYSQMDVKADEIYYGDDAIFYMNVMGNLTHQPTGQISVIIDGKKYTTNITDTKASLTVPNLMPKTYDLKIRYEGDEDYFKSIFHHNYTVHKKPTNMNISIDEIHYGEIGILKVTLSPEKVSTQAYMYITDENNITTKKTVYVRNGTEIKLKNYAAGTYNITVELWENLKYESSNATATFIVKKFETNLTVNATDINAGETEILNITLTPKGEVAGEAILQINNYTDIIFLKNGENSVTIENVTGGIYHVTVTFQGDKKYASSSASCTFTAKKLQTNITAKIENNILYINTTPNSTGKVLIYINDDIYEVNLTNSQAAFSISFTKAENYIFVYYQGDGYYNYTTCNLTYEYEELLNLTGYDVTYYNTESGTYYVTLTDEEGYGIANKTIIFTFKDETYALITGNDGSTNLSINLTEIGEYTITATYRNKTTENKVKVLEDAFISGNNTKAYENVDFKYTVILTDHNSKPIKNAEITFQIDGKSYKNKTDNNGKAIITLNLKEGNYKIISCYRSVNHTNDITIVDDSHLVGNDVKAYSGMNFTYAVKLTDHNNKPIENALITFKMGTKTFTNLTDKNGESTLTFNLESGNYTITATYKNRSIENNFEIIEDYILTGNDVKAYSDTEFIYKVKLTDHNGKAIKNKEITFEVDGKTYTNKTDVNGQTTLTLNLKTGNYTITVKYRNATRDNTLTIIEDYILNGNDVKAYADDNFQYRVNLTDHNGKAIKNAEITFEVDGKTYTNKTNNQGSAAITLNLQEGNCTITAIYKNTTTTNELEIIENHILTGQNIKAYEDTDFTYTITLTRTDGTPIADKEITFIINNRRYTNTTDIEGKSSKTLNLPEGNYTITAIYKDTRIINNLTIIEDNNLEGNNIRSYSERDFQYKVNLTDHNKKPVKNQEITFKINGETYKNKTDNNGQAAITLNLQEGNYTITSTYKDIKITNKLEIIETYTLKGINVKSYENFDFKYHVNLTDHNNRTIKSQEITFTIDEKTYKNKTDVNGQATITLNLKNGNYTIKATYKDISTTNQLNIIKYDLEKIESSNLTMYYKDGSKFTIRLTENGTALTNRTVQFIINGNPYKRTTNDEGYASIAINLNSGIHNITTQYNNLSSKNTITVKSTIEGSDLTKIYKNDTQYYATFFNSKGEPLKNTKITFNINGVMYERNTNENGTAKMNINLAAGTYIITATNPENGEQHSNTITVLSKIQENKDLTKYYRNASQYTLKIIDSKGNPAKAGQKVTFNINGVFYERYTNASGYAKLNINLQPGDYIITAEYEGCQESNKIKVLPTLQAKDLNKKYGTAQAFEATLLNGQGKLQANKEITFNINGVFYTRTTDNTGTAKLNINLQPGEYIITSQYNDAATSNTVKVTP